MHGAADSADVFGVVWPLVDVVAWFVAIAVAGQDLFEVKVGEELAVFAHQAGAWPLHLVSGVGIFDFPHS